MGVSSVGTGGSSWPVTGEVPGEVAGGSYLLQVQMGVLLEMQVGVPETVTRGGICCRYRWEFLGQMQGSWEYIPGKG